VASLGLIRAVEAFDPSRAVSFSSFAVPYMHDNIPKQQARISARGALQPRQLHRSGRWSGA